MKLSKILSSIWNIPIGVSIIISIEVRNHNQHTICEQIYWTATSFDPRLGSSSGHDTRM